MNKISFTFPEPFQRKSSTWPVFLPFKGCPQRCIFCSQNAQTGTKTIPLAEYYQTLQQNLEDRLKKKASPLEIAFFGGTFTGLPQYWQASFLRLAQHFREKGLITRIRCSTRPDFISPYQLKELKALGLDLVELGIQSFTNQVLEVSRRGYQAMRAKQACQEVKEAGLQLGIQLLPGLPLHSSSQWFQDVRTTVQLRPDFIRIYPCLVLKNTPLEQYWRQGNFTPWSLPGTINALMRGVIKFWRSNIPVIRIGLAPEKELTENILSGPWHPCLGYLVRSQIFYYLLTTYSLILGKGNKRLHVPKKYSGELWGFKKTNKPRLKKLGLSPDKICIWNNQYFLMELDS